MIDNKTQIQRLKLCYEADRKYYRRVLNVLLGLIPPNRRVT
jgi:hypothetical protein